jgi:hypothetical protein
MCQTSIHTNEQLIEAEKSREKEFIHELKQKLDELEHYAAASGSLEGVPTSVTMEKQRVLIDQLRQKLDLQFDENSVSKLSLVLSIDPLLFSFLYLVRKSYENWLIKRFIK